MSILTQKQIQYGFDYYHKDDLKPNSIIELSQYQGESVLTINCTQLGDHFTPQFKAPTEKRRIIQEWCKFLSDHPNAFEELSFGTRMPQVLFDAVCAQKKLKKLHIKWGVYPDLTRLAHLQSLEYLQLGSGAGVQSIDPIASLPNLVALSVENFQKINDYSVFAKLKKLESLSIEGDGFGPQYIHVDSLAFLASMQQLRFFRFLTARLKSKDMTPLFNLVNLEHLTLRKSKDVKEIYKQLLTLPKLKYGSLIENPYLYNDYC